MYREVKKETANLAPEDAQRLLQYNTYLGQRKLRKSRLAELSHKIKSGLWTVGNVAFAHLNGDQIMVNGQHCTTVVSDYDKPDVRFPFSIVHFQCDSPLDLANLYNQFDPRASARTTREMLDSLASNVSWMHDLMPTIRTLGHAGLLVARRYKEGQVNPFTNNGSTVGTSAENIMSLVSYRDELFFLQEVLCPPGGSIFDTRPLQKRAVAAAIFLTFWKDTQAAHNFWQMVATGEGVAFRDPTYLLREFLRSVGLSKAVVAGTKRVVTDREVFVKCLNAWNHWRAGTVPKVLRYDSAAKTQTPIK